MKKRYDALVVGAGVAGIHAALDLAETGQKVVLTDLRANIGGLLTQLDHQFPSDHCGMCKLLPLTERDSSSQFCLRKGLFHRNIDLALMTELTDLQGDPGQFKARLRTQSPFVDPTKCIGCGLCSHVCPVRVPSEFNAGLSERAAIHLPVPHAIPNHYTVDLDNCVRCLECVSSCPTEAIDFRLEHRREFPVLVVAPDKTLGERLKEWFGELHFPVVIATTAEQAVELLHEHSIQLVLLSLDLEVDAIKRVISRGKEREPDLAIAFLQQEIHPAASSMKEFQELGVCEVAPHPLEKKPLCHWVEKRFMRIDTDAYHEIDVGAVILAAGFDLFDPREDSCFALYGQHPGVLTSLEFERLISSSGPSPRTDKTLRRKDGKEVRKIAWLQCVGSRDIKKNADFCSSICCMISIKEALLAKRNACAAGNTDVGTTIFYMDMRTCGKNFQQYRDSAELEQGVRFVRSRIHSLERAMDGSDGVLLRYVNNEGELVAETYDMAVLAVGARPPKSMQSLAAVTGVQTNQWGFCKTKPYAPSRTSQLGVMAAGAFAGAKDIADSMILSGAAALEASRLINIYAPLKKKEPEPEPAYRDISREAPQGLAVLCTSCPLLKERINYDELLDSIKKIHGVDHVVGVNRCCTQSGWDELRTHVNEHAPNRVIIGACMPYAYVPKLRELGSAISLDPKLMHVVDIYSSLMGTPGAQENELAPPNALSSHVTTLMSVAAAKLTHQDPAPLPAPVSVFREALVVGGGVAGMTAALGIADHGYGVCLVEQGPRLGGLAKKIRYTLEDNNPQEFLENMVESVLNHPHIKVFTNTDVTFSTGRVGRFMSLLSTDSGTYPLEHGVTILATGGKESNVYDFGLVSQKCVITQRDLEERLAAGTLDLAQVNGVAMIQCWRSREEGRNYCSKVCCPQALKNMLLLKKRRPDLPVYVFYRDIMATGFMETFYTQARKAGVLFFQYDQNTKPEVAFENGKAVIMAVDPILHRPVQMRVDLLALSVGLEPNDSAELTEVFGIPTTDDGFFQEAESKWRPVDFIKQGVFMCGVARAPGNLKDTIASAKAAAQRSLRILSEKRLVCSNTVAEVRHSLCSRCGACISICPYDARLLDMAADRVVVDEHLCQGCGACAAVCPNSASYLRGFTDKQMLSMIDASLTSAVPEE